MPHSATAPLWHAGTKCEFFTVNGTEQWVRVKGLDPNTPATITVTATKTDAADADVSASHPVH